MLFAGYTFSTSLWVVYCQQNLNTFLALGEIVLGIFMRKLEVSLESILRLYAFWVIRIRGKLS